jgi:hypothetical protein
MNSYLYNIALKIIGPNIYLKNTVTEVEKRISWKFLPHPVSLSTLRSLCYFYLTFTHKE